jgi:hypothetical protein
MITYIYIIITFAFLIGVKLICVKTKKEKKNNNEITIEYLYWKKLYYKSLTMNNIKTGMKKWKSCNF